MFWFQSVFLITYTASHKPDKERRKKKSDNIWDFRGGAVVKISSSNAGGSDLNPGQEAKTLHASQPKNQSRKQKQYCSKFNKDFKNGPH